MDLNLIRKMAGIPSQDVTTVTSTNVVANEFRKLAGLSPLPIKEEPKEEPQEEMPDEEPIEEPQEEMPEEEPKEEPQEEMPEEELPEIVKQIAAKAEGMKGDELIELIKKVYDAGVADGMNQAEIGQEASVSEGTYTRLNTYRINGQDLIDELSNEDGAEVQMVGDDVAILVVDTITFPELASMASKLAQQGKIKAIAGHATRDITGKAVPLDRKSKYISAPSPRDPK